ncbi:MAG TPA: PilT/PilU family type 4a pilus ATPase [Opitutaceae bacterium]
MSNPLSQLALSPLFQTGEFGDKEVADAFKKLLNDCQDAGVSDLHLSAGARPFARRNGELHYLSETPFGHDRAEVANLCMLNEAQFKTLQETYDLEFSLAFGDTQRFRACVTLHKWGVAGSYRIVPARILSLEALGFKNPEPIRKLLAYHNGLVLVTGPTNSGKTTTLATMVDEINRKREDHVITVEDPVEFVQPSQGCNITQRQVGDHTRSFSSALKGALRQDPDVIIIGEMRDLETIAIAITAAETGHLVIGTMHTADAGSTLSRILDAFPPAQQAQIRATVSESLRGIICQRLLPAADGGSALACELLVANLAVANLVRDNKLHLLKTVIETGQRDGMSTMDNSIVALFRAGRITRETAFASFNDRASRRQIEAAAA